MKEMNEYSKNEKDLRNWHKNTILLIEEWGFENFRKGYAEFISDDDGYIKDLPHIEAIGDIGLFNDDLKACYQAEIDGIELIYYNNIGYIKTAEAYESILIEIQNDHKKFITKRCVKIK